MSFQIIVIVCLILIGLIIVFRKRTRLDLLDIFIISLIIFLGFYPLLDIVNGNYEVRNDVFVLTVFYISLTALLLKLITKSLLNKSLVDNLRFDGFIKRVSSVPQSVIFVLFLTAISLVLYYFLRYSLIFRIANVELEIINNYKQVILAVVFPLFTLVSISIITKLFNKGNKKTVNFLNVIILISISLYWLFWGRREFIFHILIIGLIWYIYAGGRIKVKSLIYGILCSALIILASNIYQNMRYEIMTYSIDQEIEMPKTLLEMAFDFESSDNNLKERTSILPLISSVIDEFSGDKQLSNGEILISGIQNSVPSILNKDKVFIDDDKIVARQLQIPYTDMGTSLFTSFYVDFGLLSFLILPIFLCLYYLIVVFVLFYLKASKLLFILVYLAALTTTFNMETSVSGMIISIRQILLLTLVYFLFSRLLRTFFNIRL